MTQPQKVNSIILAAGKGTRLKSNFIKVLHTVANKPLVTHVLDAVNDISANTYLIVGHQADLLKQTLNDPTLTYVEQTEQLGTGHAVQQAIPLLEKTTTPYTLVLAGDCPLIETSTLKELLNYHCKHQSTATILSTTMKNPTGYGRILRSSNNHVLGIKEQKDCTAEQTQISEVNSGIYLFNTDILISYINKLTTNNKQGEYYLTDIIEILREANHKIDAFNMPDPNQFTGVNTREELANISSIVFKKINSFHMNNGVTIINPDTTFIDNSVTIGKDTIIHPMTVLRGSTSIGENCTLPPFTSLVNENIPDNTAL